MYTTRSFPVFVLAVLVVIVELGQAFFLPGATQHHCPPRRQGQGPSGYNSPSREPNSVVLSAAQKKRRRRRKESKSSSPPPPSEAGEGGGGVESSDEPQLGRGGSGGGGGELPEFDLDDAGEAAANAPPKKKINPDEITANMMGSGNVNAARSLDELISDRTLENRLEFDEKGDPGIPDFVDLARASSTPQSYDSSASASDSPATAEIGKKKQRRAERVANAIAAKEAEESEKSFLSSIPQFLNEKGEVSPIKILEQGAWTGIFLLIGWEVYINSPLFERAAPMAPIVYEILM
mmetsp:Transcript_919/g.2334  ORF Transcript_919/g.2334 Transcript_919/m.2334 type:complete len:293 (-) Transcript_919:154-1032(-)|eukprot:CAMPEP_0172355824 /NCGR_PEP_ID=MMETSP1060-20121228/217_1 /TAXON_ID=37318 /ORGANISM="Pseudo-nitzschia pungens, Strain cf. cingulata" /LENGTH=292 /DNA_ID=CAMNT_0013075675 /DNA_START=144 /DNA_END=1022 /DNA_ORIENTATION=-